MVRPSCPALVIHDDDAYRKALIAALDRQHFTVTFDADGDGVADILRTRTFKVILLEVNLANHVGRRALEHLRAAKQKLSCGVLILGDPHPDIRTFAPWADETLLKPVDADYVATRARSYCDCG
jgi:DNA-binding response OmpR family regulator